MAQIRRITGADGAALQHVRLRALADTPSAFASTYEQEHGRPADEWNQRASDGSTGPLRATFLAWEGQEVVAIVGGYRDGTEGSAVELVSMWVSPAARGNGLGARLVRAVVDWAESIDASAVQLWVTETNQVARTLYESCGFFEMGEYQPLPSDPCRNETRMRLDLPSAGCDPAVDR